MKNIHHTVLSATRSLNHIFFNTFDLSEVTSQISEFDKQ